MLYYVFAWYLIGVLCWTLFEAQDGDFTLFHLLHAMLFGMFGLFIPFFYFILKMMKIFLKIGTISGEIVLWRRKP